MVPRRDVANQRQVQEAVDSTLKRLGQIDVLINLNNAGRELRGAAEEASPKQVRSVFAGNVGGLLTVTQAVVSSMRAGTRTLNWLSQQMLPLPWPVAAHRSAESGLPPAGARGTADPNIRRWRNRYRTPSSETAGIVVGRRTLTSTYTAPWSCPPWERNFQSRIQVYTRWRLPVCNTHHWGR
jgi:NAD(P)-dependent dehydrogenase (short-subunit alcohol dehydrogenase family)